MFNRVCGLMIPVYFLFNCLWAAPIPENKNKNVLPPIHPTQLLTLENYLPRFLNADPTLHIKTLETAIAELNLKRSNDRWSANLQAMPGLGYDRFIYHLSVPDQNLGKAMATGVNADINDPWGGTLQSKSEGHYLRKAAVSNSGHHAATSISYAMPLLRNTLGHLYDLETTYLALGFQAKKAETQNHIIERCTAGIDIYITAYLLQEQWKVWQELLNLKEQTFLRTKQDYQRRMVNKLDYLASESDWIATQQRNEQIKTQREQTRVSLTSYLDTSSHSISLISPEGNLDFIATAQTTLEKHPLARAYKASASSYRAQADFEDQRQRAEIALVPELGVNYYSHFMQITNRNKNTALTDISLMASLVLTLPILNPMRDYTVKILKERNKQDLLQYKEILRQLKERIQLALNAKNEAEARLALTEQKREVVAKQLKEANDRFNIGRLEFQDYLQHWSLYESVRFEALDLSYAKWKAQIELIRSLGQLPDMCKIETL